MDTMEKLASLMATEEFAATVDRMESAEELYAFLVAHGINISFQQVAEIVHSVNEAAHAPASSELSDPAMESVAGGRSTTALWHLFKQDVQNFRWNYALLMNRQGHIPVRLHNGQTYSSGAGRRR